MKATIERATLLKSLSHVQSVVERRNTIPILSNVLIDASQDGSIRLMATDLDLQVDESIQATVATPARRPFPPTPCSTSSASCPRAARSS
jgi:DNA polymerase-3 subunit beta